jgi:DNA ligase-1
MKAFANLLHCLILSQSRNRKLDILTRYFEKTPDPERGYALAILTDNLSFPLIKSSQLKVLILEKIDPVLFGYSHDYVGDLAETIAFLWPDATGQLPGNLENIIQTLQIHDKLTCLSHIAGWLNAATPVERWALVHNGGFAYRTFPTPCQDSPGAAFGYGKGRGN